jgi:DNA transformation protein and related proteins
MPVQPQFLDYMLEQLARVDSLRWRRMFGAVGLYSGDLFFGLIDDDTVYFKADAGTSAPYRARNMRRFMPLADAADSDRGYFQVPAEVLEDAEELLGWARPAIAVAHAAHAAKLARKMKPEARPKAKRKSSRKKSARKPPAKKVRRGPRPSRR